MKKAIARNQLYVTVQHLVTDFFSLSASTFYNLSDKSFVLVITLLYNLSDNADIIAYLNINFSREGTNFAKNLGSGGMVRARIYF